MSYPAPVYLGDTGEVTATIRPGSTPAELPRPGGAAHYLATGQLTAGRFGLYRWDMGPEPAGANAHFHRHGFEGLVEMAEGRWRPTHEELLAFCEEHDNIYV